jgi:hypothetical protein
VIVNRRRAARRRPEPRGLDGVVACLSPVGWLSAGLAVVWVIAGLQPLTNPGVLGQAGFAALAMHVFRTMGDAAMVALPAALELGYPGVGRRNRRLRRGFVLLALAGVLRPVLGFAQTLIVNTMDPGSEQVFDPATALGLAFTLLSIASGLLLVGGLWATSDGLADAGASPRRLVVPLMAVAGAAVTVIAYLPYLGQGLDMTKVAGWVNLAALALSLLQIGLWIAVGVRLVYGGVMGLPPRPAWLAGLAAGVLILVLRFGSPAALAIQQDLGLGPILSGIGSAMGILLLLAAIEGLGRGTRRRRIRPSLVCLYVLHPTD